MKDKEKQIEEMAKIIKTANEINCIRTCDNCEYYEDDVKCISFGQAIALYNVSYRKIDKDSVVLSKEEYEKLRSLYDCEQGSYMTSSIGDLPLTIEGLRKAVDEITRLNRVEAELQELNAKYYNEAKDLRRELKQARRETAEKILKDLIKNCQYTFGINGKPIIALDGDFALNVAKQFGVEIKELKK